MRSASQNTTTATFNPETHTGLVFDFTFLWSRAKTKTRMMRNTSWNQN